MPIIYVIRSTIAACFFVVCVICYLLIRHAIGVEHRKRKSLLYLRYAFLLNAICLLLESAVFLVQYSSFSGKEIILRIIVFADSAFLIAILYEEELMLEAALNAVGRVIPFWYHRMVRIFCLLNCICLLLCQFYPFHYEFTKRGTFLRMIGMDLFNIGVLCLFLVILVLMINYRDRLDQSTFHLYLSILCLMICSTLLQFIFKEIYFINIANALGLMAIFFRFEQELGTIMIEREKQQRETESELLKAKLELSETKTRIMLSQVGPHFIFNSLTCIRSLISQDPEEARKAVGYFAKYLRNDLQFLEQKELTDIDQEIQFMQNYLYMEKLRFGDSLKVELEKEDISFLLPPLTLQPLVDNAIKHGIRKKESGEGTVRVHIFQDTMDYIIEVEDDGVGFPNIMEAVMNTEHTGLRNIRSRLAIMCQGSLQIESQPGQYSRVTVRIPKEKNEYSVE